MKLLYCPHCGDIFNLKLKLKECSCGKTKGNYLSNGDDVIISRESIPIGFANSSFEIAMKANKHINLGSNFIAFFISEFSSKLHFFDKENKNDLS